MITVTNKAIYQQIADRICDDILAGQISAGQRLPSVREYASLMQVNPNTMMRTYDSLARDGIIYNRRGVGYFVADTARTDIHNSRAATFLNNDMYTFFSRLSLLEITPEQLAAQYAAYLADNTKKQPTE